MFVPRKFGAIRYPLRLWLTSLPLYRCLVDACGIRLSTRTDWITSGGNTSSSGSGTSLAAVSTPASLVAVSTPAASTQSSSILDCVPQFQVRMPSGVRRHTYKYINIYTRNLPWPIRATRHGDFTGVLLTCNDTACGGIREPNAVAFPSYIDA